MPILNFSKNTRTSGSGWTEALLRQAWKLVLNNDVDLDPSTMTHKDFCDAWANYRLKHLRG